jgi:hypothetical protein
VFIPDGNPIARCIMPRKRKQPPEETPKAEAEQESSTPASSQGETVASYFRKVFAENPNLLNERSNEELYRRWLADHPGHTEVPDRVRIVLHNIKSVLKNIRKHERDEYGEEEGA